MTKQEILAVARPILFNTEMVRAILDGRKTVTRRVIKPQPEVDQDGMWHWKDCQWMDRGLGFPISAIKDFAPCQPGDYLYVRETWRAQAAHRFEANARIEFKAGGPMQTIQFANGSSQDANRMDYDAFLIKWFDHARWHPSIHMPKEAARIFLWVTEVRVERLQDITEEQAQAEGAKMMTTPNIPDAGRTYRQGFGELWNSTIKPADLPLYAWEANPWVWVIGFEQVKPEEAN